MRISWEEAIDIVASELKRIKEKYGNKAIVAKHQDKVLMLLAVLVGSYIRIVMASAYRKMSEDW